jgi:hypothetical protein
MLSFQPHTMETSETADTPAEALQRMASPLARAAAETAGAFFCAEASLPRSRAIPRFSEFGALRCSQKNVGDKHEMICNLAVDQKEWDRLFKAGESEELKKDAFSELANCICGAVLAHPLFSDEFGYLIPCVPCSGPAVLPSGSSRLKGAFKMGGAWIRYSFRVAKAAGVLSAADRLNAAVA